MPGQCIAYRIEAINRGNVSLTDIVIKDRLQSKNDSNNSLITSTLVNPIPIGENSGTPSFATNSVSIGNNGTVITNTFSLGATTALAVRPFVLILNMVLPLVTKHLCIELLSTQSSPVFLDRAFTVRSS